MHVTKAIVITLFGLAFSQMGLQAILPEKDLTTLTVEEAKQAARLVDGGEEPSKLVEAAIRSNRLDLMAVYLEGRGTEGITQYEIEKMPYSLFKARATVMMLKSLVGFFPWERDGIPPRNLPFPPSPKSEPYRSVVMHLLPERVLPEDVFYTKASRMALVAELEAAIAVREGEPKPATPATPPAEKENATPIPKAVPAEPAQPHPAPPPSPASAPTPPVKTEPRAPVWPWLAGIAALLILGALLFKRRV